MLDEWGALPFHPDGYAGVGQVLLDVLDGVLAEVRHGGDQGGVRFAFGEHLAEMLRLAGAAAGEGGYSNWQRIVWANALIGGGAATVEFSGALRSASWSGKMSKAGKVSGIVGVTLDVISLVKAHKEGDVGEQIASVGSIGAGVWAYFVPGMWWLPVAGAGGQIATAGGGEIYMALEKKKAYKKMCLEAARWLGRSMGGVVVMEGPLWRALSVLTAFGVPWPND